MQKITVREACILDGRLHPENGKAYFYFSLAHSQWELVSKAEVNDLDTLHDGYISRITINAYPNERVEFLVLNAPELVYEYGVLRLEGANEEKWALIESLNQRAREIDGTRP